MEKPVDAGNRPVAASAPARPAAGSRRVLVFWLLLAVAVVAAYFIISAGRERSLAALQLQPLTGDATAVSLADIQGHVTLLNFWGTWCPPCRLEFPHMVELHQKYRGRADFKLLAVSCGGSPELDADREFLREETAAYLKQENADLPTFTDSGNVTREAVGDAVGVRGYYPMTILLDRRGVIQGVWTGYQPGVEIAMGQMVEKLLAK